MTEPVTPPAGTNPPASTPPSGTDPKKTDNGGFDPSKLSDEDLAKLFDDQRLYKHERFKQLNERAKKAKEYEENQTKLEEERLKKEKKFEELSTKKEEEANQWRNKYQNSVVDNKILAEAGKKGVIDLDAALKLIDRNAIKLEEDGTVTGVEEALNALAEARPYLLTIPKQKMGGNGTNPKDTAGGKRYKMSEIQNPKFYQDNQADIQLAMQEGRIDDDRP